MITIVFISLVRANGLEPSRLAAYAPQTDACRKPNPNKHKQLANLAGVCGGIGSVFFSI